ncbi:MAG: carbon-nitrogen hydrolase family protein [Gammaproteobacteria bacterium]|nr:MAG: carbon-nitrogen hydrolase family protein [Gammaproteobacteria bacterium]
MSKIALIQMRSGAKVAANLQDAAAYITQAAALGARLAVLPENFALMASETQRLDIAEEPGAGQLQDYLSEQARNNGIWLVAGTIPLLDNDNESADRPPAASCLVIDSDGRQVARYDKIHLFDVGIPGREEAYHESAHTRAGDKAVCVDTPVGRLGLAVCYDIRFPALFMQLLDQGMEVLALPAAFTAGTGKVHWEILLRARAIESLCYVAAAAQGGRHENGRESWGHSMLVDPWGAIEGEMDKEPGVLIAAINIGELARVRQRFPVLTHQRLDQQYR